MNSTPLPASAVVVDDEPFALKLLARQLRNLGVVQVDSFEHASEALTWLESGHHAVELVCCDLQMPQLDGVEFVRHLARMNFKGAVLLVSGEDDRILQTARKLAEAHRLQVLGALHKPVTPEQLRQLLTLKREAIAPARPAATPYPAEEVHRAIEQGELVNHYQPRVDIVTGELTGAETLVRWRHPTDGLVCPDRFIGVAEENGLIDELTRVVLAGPNGALQQARYWQQAGLLFPVAVNVSVDTLAGHDFPDYVASEMLRAGVPTSRLVLEVTESRLMKDPLATIDTLTRLRLRRIGLSIDDFGTGHSSLAQLRDIPFDELKVDRSFVHGAHKDASLNAILHASLGLARQLGLTVVAEGVEDFDDWCHLHAAGCDQAQGYFIARPMPPENFSAWLADWRQRRERFASAPVG